MYVFLLDSVVYERITNVIGMQCNQVSLDNEKIIDWRNSTARLGVLRIYPLKLTMKYALEISSQYIN